MAEVQLEQCVGVILCGLSAAARKTLQFLIDQYVGILTAEKIRLQAYATKLDIATAPVQIANTLVQAAVNEAQGVLGLLPTAVLSTPCTDWAYVPNTVNGTLNIVTRAANEWTSKLSRLVSFSDEALTLITSLDEEIQIYTQIGTYLQNCATNPALALP